MSEFAGKVVVVTGATGNLGSATARIFLDAGAHLVLVDRNAERQREMYADIQDSKEHYLASPVDLLDLDQVKAVVDEAVARFGRLDVLVNTVGGFRAGSPLHETKPDTWELMMQLNARTVFNACKAVIPQMVAQGAGKIVNVAARAGLQGSAKMAAYAASKAAVIRETESMAAELRPLGVNVNCILPGTIDTPENREAMPDADFSRWVAPESLAEVIRFLASDAARDIHGAAVPVYGKS